MKRHSSLDPKFSAQDAQQLKFSKEGRNIDLSSPLITSLLQPVFFTVVNEKITKRSKFHLKIVPNICIFGFSHNSKRYCTHVPSLNKSL